MAITAILPRATSAQEPASPNIPPAVTPSEPTEPTENVPDLQLYLSPSLAQRLTSGTISERFQVNDTIVGTSVTGSGTLRGRFNLLLFDSDRGWWRFQGTSQSNTTAVTADARVSQRTTTRIEAKIPVYWHQNRFMAGRPQVTATASIQPLSADSNRESRLFSRAIARRATAQAEADRPAAERESAAKTKDQIERRMAAEVAKELKKWNEQASDLLAQLTIQDGKPPELRFDKVADGIRVSIALKGNLTEGSRQGRSNQAVLSLSVHQSLLSQLGTVNLRGRTVTSRELADWFDANAIAENDELQVTFSEIDPWQCQINGAIIELRASISELTTPRGSLGDLKLRATYRLHRNGSEGWILTREEPPRLEIGDGSGGVNIRAVAVRRVAINLLERDLPETIAIKPLVETLIAPLMAETDLDPSLQLKSIVPQAGRIEAQWEETQTQARPQAGFRGLPPSQPITPESTRG